MKALLYIIIGLVVFYLSFNIPSPLAAMMGHNNDMGIILVGLSMIMTTIVICTLIILDRMKK